MSIYKKPFAFCLCTDADIIMDLSNVLMVTNFEVI